jgi:hypothetical protein
MHHAVRVLLESLVDYAGLFPPSALPMEKAVANFADYRSGADSWMLGRFVVPVSRLSELEATAATLAAPGEPWRLSSLAGNDLKQDAKTIAAFNDANGRRFAIDTVEVKTPGAAAIERAARAFSREATVYCEIPLEKSAELAHVIAQHRVRAKIRTGGLTEDSFPPANGVVSFLESCACEGVAFKATAGLHHPLRCVRPLTYEAGSTNGTMHGFLNVFLAAAFVSGGMSSDNALAVMTEESIDAFDVSDSEIRWHDYAVAASDLESVRRDFAISFGSCSFEEPVEELREAGWL